MKKLLKQTCNLHVKCQGCIYTWMVVLVIEQFQCSMNQGNTHLLFQIPALSKASKYFHLELILFQNSLPSYPLQPISPASDLLEGSSHKPSLDLASSLLWLPQSHLKHPPLYHHMPASLSALLCLNYVILSFFSAVCKECMLLALFQSNSSSSIGPSSGLTYQEKLSLMCLLFLWYFTPSELCCVLLY